LHSQKKENVRDQSIFNSQFVSVSKLHKRLILRFNLKIIRTLLFAFLVGACVIFTVWAYLISNPMFKNLVTGSLIMGMLFMFHMISKNHNY